MTPYEKVRIARAPGRPTAAAYVRGIFKDPFEFHGDRTFRDDPAVIGGVALLEGQPVTYIGIEKGTDMSSRISCNFGSPHPEGYRKALRLMEQAEKFGRPVVCFVDTSGAACDEEAENRGQGWAIAENLAKLMTLKTPVVSMIIGEGGSGGALALAVADRVFMLENAVYSVISPEGCASILWHDAAKAPQAAESLCLTAEDMKRLRIVEEVIPEDFDHFPVMLRSLKGLLVKQLDALCRTPHRKLLADRCDRYRRVGVYAEE